MYDAVWGVGQLICPTGDREKMGRKRGDKRRDKGTAKDSMEEAFRKKMLERCQIAQLLGI